MIKALTLGFTAILAAAVLGVGTAAAKDGAIIKTGKCSAASTWKLKLSPENGKIEVEFEVDQNVNGQTWNVTIKDNGVVAAQGSAITRAPSGSFEFRRVIANKLGPDNIVAQARNARTGESCTGSATF
jgi:hypothetical protein